MRKAIFVSALVVTVSLAAPAAAGSKNKATGGYTTPTADQLQSHRSLNAQGTPASAKGQVQNRIIDPATDAVARQWHGVVDCYQQVGNRAWISGQITKSQGGADVEGDYFLWAVEDNGEGAKAQPDEHRGLRSPVPFDCATATLQPTQPVIKGNIQVH